MKFLTWLLSMVCFVSLLAWGGRWYQLGHVDLHATALVLAAIVLRVCVGLLYVRTIDRRIEDNHRAIRQNGGTP